MDDVHWRRTLIAADATIIDAVQSLERSALKLALMVDAEGVLLGTVSDGDIRRGVLRGLSLDAPATEVMHTTPLIVPRDMPIDTVLGLMRANKIVQLPVVDEGRRVIGLHVWDELLDRPNRPNTMVIMAGGRGVRLGEHTKHVPKPLVPVGDKPMLEHIIQHARADGFTRFVLAIHHMGHLIEEYFGDGSSLDVDIRYSREQEPLGTGGALSLIDEELAEPLIVTNGDVLTRLRYSEILDFHNRHSAAATMAVRFHEMQNPFGVVHTRGVDIIGFEEKPVLRSSINAGVYVLEPRALRLLKRGEPCDMPTVFERLQDASERTIVYPMHEPWLDVGRPSDLELARTNHAEQGFPTPHHMAGEH
jgi:dTDP-glucose pyrophosphorylase